MIGAVAQCYQYNVFYQGDNLPLLWYLGKLKFMEEIKCSIKSVKVLWNFSYLEGIKEIKVSSEILYPYPYPETSLTLGMPRAYPIAQYIAQHTAYP